MTDRHGNGPPVPAGDHAIRVRVLVVDDDGPLTDLLSMAFRQERWEVTVAHSGREALAAASRFRPDIAVLDIGLPDINGFRLMHGIRREAPNLPILFLTVRRDVESRITGLAEGGDDYISKPFSLEELVMRMRGLLRRSAITAARRASILVVGDLVLDEDTYDVRLRGDPIDLTITEFDVLRCLMRSPDRVVTRGEILDRVWGHRDTRRTPIVELHISHLRKKIDTGRRSMIRTVRGVGYIMMPPNAD